MIDKMPHLIKIHGGSIFSNWTNAAMALHHAEGLDIRLQKAVSQAQLLISELNKIPEVKITPYEHGSNIFQMTIGNTIDTKKLSDSLREKFNIQIGQPDNSSVIRFMVNETLLRKPNDYIVKAFSEAVKSSGR